MSSLPLVSQFYNNWMGVGGARDNDNYLEDDWMGSGEGCTLDDLVNADFSEKIKECPKMLTWNALAFFGNMARCVGYALATISLLGLVIGAYKGDTFMVCRRAFSNLKFMGHNLAMLVKFTVGVIPFLNRGAAALVEYVTQD